VFKINITIKAGKITMVAKSTLNKWIETEKFKK
jgi:hypothetical protein